MRRLVAVIVFLASVTASAEVREVKNLDEIQHAFRPDARIRVVSVWATWCAPCVAEIGGIDDVAKSFRKTPVEIVAYPSTTPLRRSERRESRRCRAS
ncbi:MAG TPA: hypothetical protein VH087_04885 [Thermoanaerobaculia bacterium]|nr:hypothetical protein [Thermoanaerobaculia bacterium]